VKRALFLTLFLAGCNSEPTSTGTPQRPAAATRVLYGPSGSTKLTPFPSNRYTRADASSPTGRRVLVSPETTGDAIVALYPSITDQLNEQDGFSVIGGITVHFSGPIDPALVDRKIEDYLVAGAPLRLIDVDPTSPERGTSRGLVLRYYPDETEDGQGDNVLIAQPSTPLRPRTTYLFVVTDDVKDASGAPVGASEDMAQLLQGEQPGEYERAVQGALEPLVESKTLDPEHIALASLFTTESIHEQTFAMASALRASATPSLEGDLEVAKIADGDGDRRIAFRGRFTAPEWRSATDGRWHFDAEGAPIVQADTTLEFLMVFSDREVSGPRPVVVFAHGMTSSKDVVWDVADWLADRGAVAIGIDAPLHGSRATDETKGNMFATAFGFFSVDVESKTFDLTKGRDNFRQMSSDQLQLVRALRGPLGKLDLLPVDAPDGVPDLDPEHIAYLGTSFGALVSPTALALAPEIKGAVLNVGGGGLTTVVFSSPAFQLIVPALFQPDTSKGDMARIFSAAQGLYDPGDPINYASFVTLTAPPGQSDWSPRCVLVQEAMNDTLMPNESTSLLARTMGLTLVSPALSEIDGVPVSPAPLSENLANGATGGVFQFNKADGKTAVHGSLVYSSEGKAQHGAFLKALFEEQPCVILDPYAQAQ
jgi:dienelactone hydrolase